LSGTAPQVADLLARRSAEKLKPVKLQHACDVGLFSDDRAQLDLLDLARKK
jgi:hypothetical protein